jgi:hypothetical protein
LLAANAPARADFLVIGPSDEATRHLVGEPPVASLDKGPLATLGVAVNTAGQSADDAILEFSIAPISGLPHGATILSATLSLDIAGARTSTAVPDLSINGYGDGDGVVGLGDFRKATTTLGQTGPLPDGDSGSLALPFDFNVTAFLQSLVDGKTPAAGFHLEGPAADSQIAIWGSAANDPNLRPLLSISFAPVPEPSSLVLVGLGLAGLMIFARRHPRRAA